MNFRHALGFLVFGLLLNRMPQFAPDLLAADAADGSSAGLLWLTFMSWVHIGVGASHLVRRLGNGLAGLLAYTPPIDPELIAPATPMRLLPARLPVSARPAIGIARIRPRPVLPSTPAIEAGLLDRRAA